MINSVNKKLIRGKSRDVTGRVSSRIGQAEADGLLRLSEASGRSAQEYHSASHAIWLLAIVAYDLARGDGRRNTQRRTERILAHLSCLGEFIPEGERMLPEVVNRLLENLMKGFPDCDEKWRSFMRAQWDLIRAFAAHYGHHDKFFPQSTLARIEMHESFGPARGREGDLHGNA